MSIFDDIKAKADANGDGKVSLDDLSSLKESIGDEQFAKLKDTADRNGDGKLSLKDLNNLNVGDTLNDLKDQAGDLWNKAKDSFNK